MQDTERQNGSYRWVVRTPLDAYLHSVEFAFVERLLRSAPRPYRILDIGAGGGRLALLLQRDGFDVIGVDLYPEGLQLLRQQSLSLPIGFAHALHLPFADRVMDGIVCLQVLNHLNDPNRFFRECYRLLQPGGLLLLQALNGRGYKSLVRRRTMAPEENRASSGPSGDINIEDMLNMIRSNGFNIVETQGYNWLPLQRQSRSRLAEPLGRVEALLGLRRLVRWSPWLLIAARRDANDTAAQPDNT